MDERRRKGATLGKKMNRSPGVTRLAWRGAIRQRRKPSALGDACVLHRKTWRPYVTDELTFVSTADRYVRKTRDGS